MDETRCFFTYKGERDKGIQCGLKAGKGICHFHERFFDVIDNEILLLENYFGKNKINFNYYLNLVDYSLLSSFIKNELPRFEGIKPRYRMSFNDFNNYIMTTDMTFFKDLVLLRIGPIDLLTPKVLSFMLERLFLINCILEMIKDKGIWDIKKQFMPYTIILEHLDMIYKLV